MGTELPFFWDPKKAKKNLNKLTKNKATVISKYSICRKFCCAKCANEIF